MTEQRDVTAPGFINEYGRAREIRQAVARWCTEPEPIREGHETCVSILPATPDDVLWLLDELAEAHRRMNQIIATIYDPHGFRDEEGEQLTGAKFRAIERLARRDWDAEGMSRVV